jgi:hypothetical protein
MYKIPEEEVEPIKNKIYRKDTFEVALRFLYSLRACGYSGSRGMATSEEKIEDELLRQNEFYMEKICKDYTMIFKEQAEKDRAISWYELMCKAHSGMDWDKSTEYINFMKAKYGDDYV